MSFVCILLGYALGSIPFSLLLTRLHGIDLRAVGSGNLGATNVLRSVGVALAALVAALDIGKGVLSVVLAERFSGSAVAPAAAGIAAVFGHVYPVWLRFRGGKGVATACGVFAVLAPGATLVAASLFVVLVWATKYVSVGSVLAAIALPPLAYIVGSRSETVIAAGVTAVLIVFRHRSNLGRVMSGTERRIRARA